ncbi:MAG: tetratricopeptide repeat-containing sensor histidine kinase [Bacteroidales bacterium]|nr:tetratricopeptide repeat-containing sensor histidine kinase [Bacteroidales bacterium]
MSAFVNRCCFLIMVLPLMAITPAPRQGNGSHDEIATLLGRARDIDRKSPDEMIRLATEALRLNEKDKNQGIKAEIYEILGQANYYLINFDIAADHFLMAGNLFESTGDLSGIARNFNHLSLIYKDIGDTVNALAYNRKALALFRKSGNRKGEANTLNLMGSIFLISDLEKAHKYYSASYEIRKTLDDQGDIASSMNNLGIIFQRKGATDSAVMCYEKAYEINKQLGYKQYMAVALSNIALLEEELSGPEKKVELLLEALELSSDAGHYRGMVNTLSNLAQHYFMMYDFDKSLDYLEQALKICHAEQLADFRLKIYHYYSELFRHKKDYSKAFSYMSKYNALKDSLQTATGSRISELQMRYLAEKNEKDRKLREMEVKKERNSKIFFLASAIMIAVIALLLARSYLVKKMTAKMLAGKNVQLEEINRLLTDSEKRLSHLNATKDKFFSIIAHDLKNPLGTMRSLLDYFRDNFKNFSGEQQQEYLNMLDDSMKSTYSLLQNLLQWSMSQSGRMDVTMERFDLYAVSEAVCSYTRPMAKKKSISVKNNIQRGTLVLADRNMIETVLRNLTVNAVKFSWPGKEVTVNAVQKEGKVTVKVKDQGVGLSENDISKLFRIEADTLSIGSETQDAVQFSNEKGTGLGLILCHEFIRRNGGEIRVESAPGNGATFYFTLDAAKQINR